MMLFRTALLELKKNIGAAVLTLLQIITALMITGVMVSSVLLKYQTYAPFNDYFESEGIFVEYLTDASESADMDDIMSIFNDSERLLEKTHGSEIISTHRLHMHMEHMILDLSYDDEIIRRYQPPLKAGRWLDPNADEIEIVISEENPYGWKLGDIADIYPGVAHSNDDTASVLYKARVVGILKDNAELFGTTNRNYLDINYKNAYISYNTEVEGKAILLMSQSVIKRVVPDVSTPICGVSLIKYPDGTPTETIREDQQLLSRFGRCVSQSMTEIDAKSKAYLYETLYQMLPIVVILIILVIVSAVSSSAISTRRRLKDYAKFYILGLRWRQCVLVNFFQSLIISIIALVFALVGLFIIGATPLSETFTVLWDSTVVSTLLCIPVIYLIFSMVMPIIMLNSVTPKALLQSE